MKFFEWKVVMRFIKLDFARIPISKDVSVSQFQISTTDDPFYDGCGSTKNCFGTPDGCVQLKNCKAAVSVLVRGERYLFEIHAKNSVYVAVGLSDDSKMVRLPSN